MLKHFHAHFLIFGKRVPNLFKNMKWDAQGYLPLSHLSVCKYLSGLGKGVPVCDGTSEELFCDARSHFNICHICCPFKASHWEILLRREWRQQQPEHCGILCDLQDETLTAEGKRIGCLMSSRHFGRSETPVRSQPGSGSSFLDLY